MKEPYICVHVYDDGDTELTRLELTPEGVSAKLYDGDLCFQVEMQDKIRNELTEYGSEDQDIEEALQYILNAQPGDSCIVGKL